MMSSSFNFQNIVIAFICFSICIGCTKDNEKIDLPMDYRGQWIGEYVGTKSNSSLEDDMFTQDISFEVSIDSTTSDQMIVNGITLTINENGEFGPDFISGGISTNMTVRFNDPDLTIESYGSIPNGIVLPCFINARKQ